MATPKKPKAKAKKAPKKEPVKAPPEEYGKCPECDAPLEPFEETVICSECAYVKLEELDKLDPSNQGGEVPSHQNGYSKYETFMEGVRVREKVKENREKGGVRRGRSTPETRLDVVSPGLRKLGAIKIFAWPIGVRGYRFGIIHPPLVKPAWEKQMLGTEAYRYLLKVKRANKHGRLEAFSLPVEE